MAGKLSDRELRQQALRLTDAYDQKGLVYSIPAEHQVAGLLNVYCHSAYPKEKVRCVQCGRTSHKNGFTGYLTNGQRVLFGSCCGAELFGERWDEAAERLNEQADRQYELARIDRAETMISSFIMGVRQWGPLVEYIDARQNSFERNLGRAWSALQGAWRRDGGVLSVQRKIRDFAAEQRSKSNHILYTTIDDPIGRMRGGEIFELLDLRPAVDRACEAAQAYREVFGKTDLADSTRLRRLRRAFERNASELDNVKRIYDAWEAFFEPGNLQFVSQWLRESKGIEDFVANGACVKSPRVVLRVDDLKALNLEPIELIREYRRAD